MQYRINSDDQPGQVNCQPLRILRFPEVVRKTGISRTGVYEKLRTGEFPEPVSLGERAIGFVEGEVDCYLSTLMRRRNRPQEVDA